MSFALTTDQVKAETKDVTRRLGWKTLKPGDLFCSVVKGMGLKKGEQIQRLKILRAVDVRTEPLRRMTDDLDYGFAECRREGFPEPSHKSFPSEFVRFFCASHPSCVPDTVITRIEFEYVHTPVCALPLDISDDHLVERAVRNARNTGLVDQYRWVLIKQLFACGSTVSRQICKRFGLKPDEVVRPDRRRLQKGGI